MELPNPVLLSRYKEGFERLAIVLFVVCAAGLGLARLGAGSGYEPPAGDSAQGRALEAEISRACDTEAVDVFRFVCRESVLSGYRWRHLSDNIGAPTLIVLAAACILAAAVFGHRTYRWVRQGFVSDRET